MSRRMFLVRTPGLCQSLVLFRLSKQVILLLLIKNLSLSNNGCICRFRSYLFPRSMIIGNVSYCNFVSPVYWYCFYILWDNASSGTARRHFVKIFDIDTGFLSFRLSGHEQPWILGYSLPEDWLKDYLTLHSLLVRTYQSTSIRKV